MDRRSREPATLCHCSSSACCHWTEEAAWTLPAGPGHQSSLGAPGKGCTFRFSTELQIAAGPSDSPEEAAPAGDPTWTRDGELLK